MSKQKPIINKASERKISIVKDAPAIFEFGVILLSRIKNRIESPTVKKIASIYNFLGAEKVTNYGSRVAKIYLTQPWLKQGCAQ